MWVVAVVTAAVECEISELGHAVLLAKKSRNSTFLLPYSALTVEFTW